MVIVRRLIFSSRNPDRHPSVNFATVPSRVQTKAATSQNTSYSHTPGNEPPHTPAHATAHLRARGAPCWRVPCGVDHDLRITAPLSHLAHTPLSAFYRPTDPGCGVVVASAPASAPRRRDAKGDVRSALSVSYPSAQHHSTSIAALRMKARPEAQAQQYEDYDARSVLKNHCTTSPFSAAPLLTPARATHCGGTFFDVLYPLRERPVWALYPCPPLVVLHIHMWLRVRVSSRWMLRMLHFFMCSSQMSTVSLAGILIRLREEWHFDCLAFSRDMHSRFQELSFLHSPPYALYTPCSPVVLRRSLDGRRTNESVYMSICRRATQLAFHFVFHCYCVYLPADYINTRSIPPCTTRVILGCSWLLVVLELFTVVGINLFVRRSPPEPSPSLPVLTVHGNAVGVRAKRRLIFPPTAHFIWRRCTRRAPSSWREGAFASARLARVAHISLCHPFLFFQPDISTFVSDIIYMHQGCLEGHMNILYNLLIHFRGPGSVAPVGRMIPHFPSPYLDGIECTRPMVVLRPLRLIPLPVEPLDHGTQGSNLRVW
ncbi:hypothetical protein C8R44DRAFT_991896 [Mycena epipterygia]|nr:hypothetical protein C8R44DRAFT_991896 [Mycena epipterygia]